MMITILILHESTIKHRKKGPIQTFRACALGSSGRRVRPSCGSTEFLQEGKRKGFSSGGCQLVRLACRGCHSIRPWLSLFARDDGGDDQMMMVIMTQYWGVTLNHDHDMWYALPANISGPENLGGRIHTYFCTPLLHWQCIGIALKGSSKKLKRKHETGEACATFQANIWVRQMMLDVGEGVPRAGVWQDLRSDTSGGWKRGVWTKNCVSFYPTGRSSRFHSHVQDSHVFSLICPFVWRNIREEGSSSDFKSNIRTVTSPTVSTN